MNKKGFTLIELLIVISIMAILAGVAIPYYNDYIIDSRKSVLQNNLATIRKAINQFRADNQRGPARINLASNSFVLVNGLTDPFDELVNGPLQNINGQWVRRANMKYLNTYPNLIDPNTGLQILFTSPDKVSKGQYYIELATGTCWCKNTNPFEVDNDWAYINSIGTGPYQTYFVNPFNNKPHVAGTEISLDYIDISIKEKE